MIGDNNKLLKHLTIALTVLLSSATTEISKNSNLRIKQPSPKNITDVHDFKLTSRVIANITKDARPSINFTNIPSISDTYKNVTTRIEMKKLRRRTKSSIIATRGGGRNSIGVLETCTNILQTPYFIKNVQMGSNNIVRVGSVKFSERFDGQVQTVARGVIGLIDGLSGRATSPLTLVTNYNKRENIRVAEHCEKNKCGIAIMGRGPTGIDGTGSVGILFRNDQSKVQLSFRADGSNKAVMMFFRRDGTNIGKLKVDIAIANDYSFEHVEGAIAGIAIYSIGDALKWHKFRLVGLCLQ
mmetsp:Transcript_21009/g.25993  ORF Transcript_21009/g.25993 Transcript_21009/m.25993 type:complete len:298 (+) Transcript_21009:36-929(+)